MRYAVVGPGALGCLMAAKLAEAAADPGDVLWIIDHDSERAERIGRQGILYEKFETRKSYPVCAFADPQAIGSVDVLFFCVKSYDLQAALELCRPLLRAGVLAIFMQNGIAHLDFKDRTGEAWVAFGCTSEGSTSLGVGHIRHAGDGATFLGFLEDCGPEAAESLARTVTRLQSGGLVASVSDDILARLWAKLLVNVGINALTVIHDCRNGDLLAIPEACAEMKEAVAEAGRVAVAKGIPVTGDAYQTTTEVCRATAANVSSMRQDVLKCKRTEIDAINGAVVAEAARLGIATPVNESLVLRIKAIELGGGQEQSAAGRGRADGKT